MPSKTSLDELAALLTEPYKHLELLNFEKIMFVPQAKNTFKNVLFREH